jgi:hypothetical protein
MSASSRLQMDNNNRKMNDLLKRIGTSSKPLFNKLTFKPSKKTEFLEIVERKLGNILTGINLNNIEEKISELDKIFDKLQQFSKKITNRTDENIKSRLHNIYFNNRFIFPAFSAQILRISNIPKISLDDLNKLLQLQNQLIKIYNKYKKTTNYKNLKLVKMLEVKQILDEKIKNLSRKNNNYSYSEPIKFREQNQLSNKFKEIDELCAESRILSIQLVKNEGGMIDLSEEQKQQLSIYIPDLARKIYKLIKDLKYGKHLIESKKELEELISLYSIIFIEKGKNLNNSLNTIPNNKTNTYLNLENKKQEINKLFKDEERRYREENPPTYSR